MAPEGRAALSRRAFDQALAALWTSTATAAGSLLIDKARRLLAAADELLRAVQGQIASRGGRVRLGATVQHARNGREGVDAMEAVVAGTGPAFDVILMERRKDTRVPRAAWETYLREAFAANRPYDALAREILSADGADAKTLRYAWLGRLTWGRALLGGSRPAPGP